MKTEHVISDEVLNDVMTAVTKGHSWIVYNTLSYFLDKADVRFFKTENEADDWGYLRTTARLKLTEPFI